ALHLRRAVVDPAPHGLIAVEPSAAMEGDEGPGLRVEIAIEKGDLGVLRYGVDDPVMRVAYPDRELRIAIDQNTAAEGEAGPAIRFDIGKAAGAPRGQGAVDDLLDRVGQLQLREHGRCLLSRHRCFL